MDESRHDPTTEGSLDRRTVVFAAAAAALTGAGLVKLADADEAVGSHGTNIAYDSQTVVHADVTNTTSGSTRISSNVSGTAAFVGLNNYPVGISRPDGILGRTAYTTSGCAGVAGSCEAANGGIGVLGTSLSKTGVGVFGFSGSNVPSRPMPPGTGVLGDGPQRGVAGESKAGTGVHGTTESGVAVLGVASGSGVAGRFNGRTVADGPLQVEGASQLKGAVQVDGASQLKGSLQVDGATQLRGVRVDGVLETVGKPPAAIVQGADGSPKRTYAYAGLAPSFEHVGEGKLRRGRATVRLPAELDALVPGKAYQVFLTEYGDFGGLYVTARAERQFSVRARRAANGRFGYRVVATRSDLRS